MILLTQKFDEYDENKWNKEKSSNEKELNDLS